MGVLKTLRTRHLQKKALFKAEKAKALAEAKTKAKLERATEKYIQKNAQRIRKINDQQLKKRREHEENMAKAALERMKARRFDRKNVLRVAAAGRALAPILAALVYRGVMQLQAAKAQGGVAQSMKKVSLPQKKSK